MSNSTVNAMTSNSLYILSSAEKIYEVLMDPELIVKWQAPENMLAKLHRFDFKVGGGYEMSLFYPDDMKEQMGITNRGEDRFIARFTEIIPNRKIVQVINFESHNPDFLREMTFEIELRQIDRGTRVTFTFKNIPSGIKPEDNEEGTVSSLAKLAKIAEAKSQA